jgi:hypothetical protein
VNAVQRRYLLSVVLILALAACGGDSVPSAAEDKESAEDIVLTEADVPAGLELDPDEGEDEGNDPSDIAFERCFNENQLLKDLGSDPRGAESSFTSADDSISLSSVVTLAEEEGDAEAAFDELTQTSFAGCFENALRTALEEEIGAESLRDVSVSELEGGDLGDESVGYRAEFEVANEGESLTLSSDFVFVRVARGLTGLLAFQVGEPFEEDERTRLAELLTERLSDAV